MSLLLLLVTRSLPTRSEVSELEPEELEEEDEEDSEDEDEDEDSEEEDVEELRRRFRVDSSSSFLFFFSIFRFALKRTNSQ